MKAPTQRIVRRWKRNDPITASRSNHVVDVVNDSLRGATGSRQTSPFKAARPTHQRFRIKAVGIDVLVCREWDGTTEGTVDVNVALPYILQRTPFDGQVIGGITYTYTNNFTRTATDGSTVETQKITPDYLINEEIVAVAVATIIGGVNVSNVDWAAPADGHSWAAEAVP